jgi:cyclopropane fatty-acyl-phospholipid synthase-like methyltransferase
MFPYFDTLLDHLVRGDAEAEQSWGQHVHWGYFADPAAKVSGPEEFHRASEAMLELMVRRAPLGDGMTVLDAGCGFGGTLEFLACRYRTATLVGINIDQRQLALARQRRQYPASFAAADACALPFKSACFDLILCVESIFHFDSRAAFLCEASRVLRPGGMMVLSDFVPLEYLGRLLRWAEDATHLVGRMYGRVHPDISRAAYQRLAGRHGMECVAIDDVTAHTLPTYRFLRDQLRRREQRKSFIRATSVLEWVSRLGLVRYLILTFRKPAVPSA